MLADLALESEAATALALRLAHSFDRIDSGSDEQEQRDAPRADAGGQVLDLQARRHFAQEAMECLGGNGYVEAGGEGMMARIYREMPLNSIWEGAGNIMALDLMRALRKGGASPTR